jgi:hypothetical protein
MGTIMRFEITDEMGRGDDHITFRTLPEKGTVLHGGRAVNESVDLTFDLSDLDFDGVAVCDFAIEDCLAGKPEKHRLAAYVHVWTDAKTLDWLKSLKVGEPLLVEMIQPRNAKSNELWDLHTGVAWAGVARYIDGEAMVGIGKIYQIPEEVFSNLEAQAA